MVKNNYKLVWPAFLLLYAVFLSLPCFADSDVQWQSRLQQLERERFPEAGVDSALREIYRDLNQKIKALDKQGEAVEGERLQADWQQVRAILNVRAELLATGSHSAEKMLGFGPAGVRNLQLEIRAYQVLLRVISDRSRTGWQQFSADMRLSPIPLIYALVQAVLVIVLFVMWRRRIVPRLKAYSKQHSGSERPIGATLIWWYLRIRSPFEWYVFLTILLGIVSSLLFFVPMGIVTGILDWLLLGATAIYALDTLLGYGFHGARGDDEKAVLRLRSIKLVGYVVIIIGLLSSLLTSLGLVWGTIGSWFSAVFWLISLPVVAVLLRWWRPYVFKTLRRRHYRKAPLVGWALEHQSGALSLVACLLGGLFIVIYRLGIYILTLVNEQEMVRTWMAYLFRIEVARQSAKDRDLQQMKALPTEALAHFEPNVLTDYVDDSIAVDQRLELAEICRDDKPTISVVHAPRGMGRSSFLTALAKDMQGDKSVALVQTPCGDFSTLLPAIGEALGLDAAAPMRDIVNLLKEDEPRVVFLDDVQRLIKPTINGLKELDRLVRLMRHSSAAVSWVMAIETSCWRFVELARGERFIFDREITLPGWNERQIAELIEARNKAAAIDPNFSALVLPRQLNRPADSEVEAALGSYSRILWEYSKGSPGISLFLWQQSIFIGRLNDLGEPDDQSDEQVVVRLFDIPSTASIESMSVTLLLALRAIMQLEWASKEEVASCINLSSEEVIDTLRRLVSGGYLVADDGRYSVAWPWYHAITTLLTRQHLLRL
ncbi:hypothetical protein EDC56_2288 [Sinobacterium caligoides]|uniref:ORC1/DEAH AAA+ ATPase domain-containing protein n=1 Tax=Sinobacterium caligoides TaxID=933926 RepID=A0A3N2DPY4_9GAMM|nr:AAA family ATPase [Sinobacterium caligoides]ROS01840.1 hypothetical protein EDC56_2288 [Sinobacterium caligoides]